MNRRVLRAVSSITLSLAVMGLVAYGFGRVTRTEWVWWLAPLTVALDALLFRARGRGGAAPLSPSGLHVFRDPGAPIHLVSSVVATAVTAWAACTGNRLALIIGATFAVLAKAVERGEEPAFEHTNDPA